MMAARPDSVCKYICTRGNWAVTNLQLQKILYLTQMVYMRRNNGDRLVDADFEAWDYGPVEPGVYRKVRMFGSSRIRDVFYHARTFREDDKRRSVMDEVCKDLLPLRPGELVEITHWGKGAWARYYEPGVRGIKIPGDAIIAEYKRRVEEGLID